MILTPWVDFTNFLLATFTQANPKSEKRHSSHHCLFASLGSFCVKAALKILGVCGDTVRLPLANVNENVFAQLQLAIANL